MGEGDNMGHQDREDEREIERQRDREEEEGLLPGGHNTIQCYTAKNSVSMTKDQMLYAWFRSSSAIYDDLLNTFFCLIIRKPFLMSTTLVEQEEEQSTETSMSYLYNMKNKKNREFRKNVNFTFHFKNGMRVWTTCRFKIFDFVLF